MFNLLHVADTLLRAILLILTTLSFLPQLSKIRTRRDCAGISLLSILFTLLAATNHLSLILNMIAFHWEGGFPDRPPRTVCDWLDVGQFGVAWVGQVVLFGYVVRFPPRRVVQKTFAVAGFLAVLAITVVPTIVGVFIEGEEEDEDWFVGILEGFLLFIVEPLVQILSVAALFAQAWTTMRRDSIDALSLRGLMAQAVVFLLVGLSFIYRLRIPDEVWREEPWVVALREWYWLMGWATVGNLIFAFVQGALALVAWEQERASRVGHGERMPLLSE